MVVMIAMITGWFMAISRPFAPAIGSPHDIVRLDLSPLKVPTSHIHIPAHLHVDPA